MPRLKQVSRAAASPNVLEFYDEVFGDRDPVSEPGTETGTPGNWWTTFALVPPIFDHAVEHFRIFGMFSDSSRSSLPTHWRELGIMRAGYVIGSVFVLSQHSKVARGANIDDPKIKDIGCWSASEAFDPEERIILAYADALLMQRGRVSDELFAKLKTVLSDEQILEFSYHTLSYAMHATISRALKLEYDDVEDAVKEIPVPTEH